MIWSLLVLAAETDGDLRLHFESRMNGVLNHAPSSLISRLLEEISHRAGRHNAKALETVKKQKEDPNTRKS